MPCSFLLKGRLLLPLLGSLDVVRNALEDEVELIFVTSFLDTIEPVLHLLMHLLLLLFLFLLLLHFAEHCDRGL